MRTAWSELPARVRSAVESSVDGTVVGAVSQAHGFSPGSADRIVTSTGHRAFVKAIGRDRNPHAFDLHCRELVIMASMPAGVAAPRLIGSYLDDDWVALVVDDIEGRHPRHGAEGSDVTAVLDSIARLPAVRGTHLHMLPDASVELGDDAGAWSTIVSDGATAALPGWVAANLERLDAVAQDAAAAVAGDRLVHLDCRADNIIVDASGEAWLVDWPWAAVGASWFDGVTYLLDSRLRGEGVDTELHLREHALFDGVPASSIDAVLSAITGMFFDKARQPAPPNMPTIREFQRREGLAGADCLRERWAALR